VLKSISVSRPLATISLLAILVGVIGCWAALNGFYFVFIIPALLGIILYSFFKTEAFIILVGALAPLSVNINDIGSGLGISLPTEPLIMFIFALLLFRFIYKGEIKREIAYHPLFISVFVYLLWLWVSSLFSSMPMVSAKFSIARTWYIAVFFIAGIQFSAR